MGGGGLYVRMCCIFGTSKMTVANEDSKSDRPMIDTTMLPIFGIMYVNNGM